jgi:hypothetical protein
MAEKENPAIAGCSSVNNFSFWSDGTRPDTSGLVSSHHKIIFALIFVLIFSFIFK